MNKRSGVPQTMGGAEGASGIAAALPSWVSRTSRDILARMNRGAFAE